MIYLTSDIHREWDIHKINPNEFKAGNNLTRDDYVIICGDFGCVWDSGSGDRFWLNWLETLPWTTLFIDGNHENFDALEKFPVEMWNGGKVHKIRSNVIHLMRGQVFLIDGEKFVTMGGGASHDYAARTEHETWWKQEMPNHEEVQELMKNLELNHWKVDYVLTHDIYKSHTLSNTYPIDMSVYGDEYENIQDVLEKVVQKLEYKCWFHGHYHVDEIEFIHGKPCVTLFDKVILLEDLEDEKKALD